jgi:hypothetical protein
MRYSTSISDDPLFGRIRILLWGICLIALCGVLLYLTIINFSFWSAIGAVICGLGILAGIYCLYAAFFFTERALKTAFDFFNLSGGGGEYDLLGIIFALLLLLSMWFVIWLAAWILTKAIRSFFPRKLRFY